MGPVSIKIEGVGSDPGMVETGFMIPFVWMMTVCSPVIRVPGVGWTNSRL